MRSPKSFGKPKRPSLLIRRVSGDSMAPTLRHGRLLIARQTRHVRPGDVVMVRHNGLEKVKRISALTADKVWLLGDNALASTDSRQLGWLPIQMVVAKVYWPRISKEIA